MTRLSDKYANALVLVFIKIAFFLSEKYKPINVKKSHHKSIQRILLLLTF